MESHIFEGVAPAIYIDFITGLRRGHDRVLELLSPTHPTCTSLQQTTCAEWYRGESTRDIG